MANRVFAGMRTLAGLARSVAIYYANPLKQAALVRFYRGLLRPGDLAFDIGAHVGNRARAMRRAGARVVALEPQAPFTDFLKATLPRDITLVMAAAGPEEGVMEMAVSRLHPTVSSLTSGFASTAGTLPGFGHVRWDAVQEVPVTTLDAMIATHGRPRLIKIDVEGFERDVLAGLSQPVDFVSVEYLPGMPEATAAVVADLAKLGPYRFNPVAGETHRFLWPGWRDAGAATAWLHGLDARDRSGDLYARLEGAVPEK